MANEAKVTSHIAIRKVSGNITQIDYRSPVTTFNVDVAGTKGPVPGAIEATTAGIDVDFSELITPGLCNIQNQDDTNFVTYGIYDPETTTFFPLGEVGPGESYAIKLSRDLKQEYGTGTGTTGANTNRLRIKANAASVNVYIGAFEV